MIVFEKICSDFAICELFGLFETGFHILFIHG